MHKAVQKVGQDVCNILPVMLAFTGCDSMSTLNGKGKKGVFTTFNETLTVCLKFIGLLYGEATSNLNHFR